jgi:hypothetical protein
MTIYKVREMQNSSEIFQSNFNYYQHVAHKKVFPTSLFPADASFSDL